METRFDAVIAGAGPAGSSAAIFLAQAGWRVALIEKQNFPRRKVCGDCVSASNLPLLEALGVADAFAALAGPKLRKVALMHGHDSVVARLPPAYGAMSRWGRALGREKLDSLLLSEARLAGVQVMQPWALQRFEGDPGNWNCEVRAIDTRTVLTLRAPVAIDAHGSWKRLPSESVEQPAKGSDLLAFKANFSGAFLTKGLLPVLSFKGGYGGMVMADQGVLTLACCVRRDRLAALRLASPGLSAGEVLEVMLKQECKGVEVALRTAQRIGQWLATGPLAPGIRLRSEDSIFRIGNAAAEAHPIIGEGMSMAMQSAWLLSKHLTVGVRPSLSNLEWQLAVGQGYARDWNRQFAGRLRLASALAHVAMRPRLASPLMSLIRIWPGLLPLGASWVGKTRFITTPRKTP